MSWQIKKIGGFLIRSKIPVDIQDNKEYKRVTIRINHNGVSLRDIEKGSKIGTKKQFILKAGQFILSKIDARYGAFGIAPDEVGGAIITGNFWAYDFDKKEINIDWLNQYTNSPEFYEICERASSGITHRKYLDEEVFLNHKIYLPDIDEQKNVVANVREQKQSFGILSTELTQQQDLLKQLRQSFLREAMQGKLVKQDKKDGKAIDLLKKIKAEKEELIAEKKLKKEKELPPIKAEEIPFDIPEIWVWCRLNEVCIQIVDCPHSTPKYLHSETGYYGIDTTCIDDSGKIVRLRQLSKESYEARIKRLVPTEKDIVYAREGSIGLAAFIPKDKKICLGQRVMLFRSSREIDSTFLKMVVSDEAYKNRILERHRGMGAKHVNVKDIISSVIPLPPLAEQKRIVKKLEEVMNLCDELKTTITNNQTYTDRLLQVALKDALRLKEVEETT
jgi:type I restriction enzyme S subunit